MNALQVRLCPNCRNRSAVPIIYGEPVPSAVQLARDGKTVLGGCVITDESPAWACTACGHQWGNWTAERGG